MLTNARSILMGQVFKIPEIPYNCTIEFEDGSIIQETIMASYKNHAIYKATEKYPQCRYVIAIRMEVYDE
jgi:hypothetical protein